MPHIFRKVISQSGAFQIKLGDQPPLVQMLLQTLPVQPLTIWQDVGRLEWLLHTNREVNTLLKERGYTDVTYREFAAGHNYTAWGDQVADALIAMYGIDAADE
jgi:enterochelin esterase family protein